MSTASTSRPTAERMSPPRGRSARCGSSKWRTRGKAFAGCGSACRCDMPITSPGCGSPPPWPAAISPRGASTDPGATSGMIGAMTTRRGLFVAPFDSLADPRVVGDLAASAEAAGWDGFFVWDHLQYGERVTAVADVLTCCATVATRTETLLVGPMVTPLVRRRPQVLARQAA